MPKAYSRLKFRRILRKAGSIKWKLMSAINQDKPKVSTIETSLTKLLLKSKSKDSMAIKTNKKVIL